MTRARIDQPAVDLETASGAAPDRNRLLAAALIEIDACWRRLRATVLHRCAPSGRVATRTRASAWC